MKPIKNSIRILFICILITSCYSSKKEKNDQIRSDTTSFNQIKKEEKYEIEGQEKQKPNDILVTIIMNLGITIEEIDKCQMSQENTQLLTKENYRTSNFIKKKFTTPSGTFDEKQFEDAYKKASYYFDMMATTNIELQKRLEETIDYNHDSRFKPIGSKTSSSI